MTMEAKEWYSNRLHALLLPLISSGLVGSPYHMSLADDSLLSILICIFTSLFRGLGSCSDQ